MPVALMLVLALSWPLPGLAAAEAAEAASAGSPPPPSAIVIDPPQFPNLIGILDHERLPMTIANGGNALASITIEFTGGGAPQRQSIELGGHHAITAIVEFACAPNAGAAVRQLSISDARGRVLYLRKLLCIATDGDARGVRWTGHRYVDADGDQVVLVAPSISETVHRRWALLRALEGNPLSSMRTIMLWSWSGSQADDPDGLARQLAGACPGRSVSFLPYDGDPCAAALTAWQSAAIPDGALVCLAWGSEEAFQRRSCAELRTALVVAASRILRANPRNRVIMATPVPLLGEIAVSERYAQAVRDAAHAAGVPVADWHAAILALPHWQSHFLIDGDPALASRFPSPSGLAVLADAIAQALR